MSRIGARAPRKEDARFLRGAGRYVADVKRPGMVEAAIVRSTHAHARIASLDLGAALAHPDVLAVLTPEDVASLDRIPVRVKQRPLHEVDPFLQPVLADGTVRYVGEPIAVVVARDRYVAEDAVELVEVGYEPLPAVTDPVAAADAVDDLLVPAVGHNVAATIDADVGDVEAAIARADLVVSERFSVQRHGAVPLETRGLVAELDPGSGRLTVWGPTKVVHANRQLLASMLGLTPDRIRFVEPDVGGGFGGRGEFYPEDLLIPLAALRIGRPVRWIEDREENLMACNHSREQHHEARLAVSGDGELLALDVRVVNNMGAYVRTHGIRVPELTVNNYPGPYRLRNYRCHVDCVVTNKTPAGTYRCPGRFEGNFVRERLIDIAAGRLGIDPVEMRRRNLIPPDEIPWEVGTYNLDEPVTFDSGDPPHLMERAVELVGYEEFRVEQERARAEGRRLGIGFSCYFEESGLGGPGNTPGEYARVVVGADGHAIVYSGVAALGQGLETVLAQICSEALDVPYENVRVLHGDTDLVPFGGGTWADRGSILGGSACLEAAQAARARLIEVAAALLAAPESAVSLREGTATASVDGDERSMPFGEIVAATFDPARWPHAPGVEGSAVFTAARMTHAPGVDAAIVEVDPGTGLVTIVKHVIVYDIGRCLNPAIVEGQVEGGAAQGIGGAFLEEFVYGDDGQPLATSFRDYLLCGASELPRERIVEVREDHPSPLNPLGIKGAGEVGPAGAGGAFANAVADALGEGEEPITSLPLSPSKVLDYALRTCLPGFARRS